MAATFVYHWIVPFDDFVSVPWYFQWLRFSDAQRKSEVLRAFAQSLSTAGLGLLAWRDSFSITFGIWAKYVKTMNEVLQYI
uniref:Uncharacterized protein n=1 Tax=mine drainage metagenome TaxID=410659 RepID=E6PQH9_9ZZZZ